MDGISVSWLAVKWDLGCGLVFAVVAAVVFVLFLRFLIEDIREEKQKAAKDKNRIANLQQTGAENAEARIKKIEKKMQRRRKGLGLKSTAAFTVITALLTAAILAMWVAPAALDLYHKDAVVYKGGFEVAVYNNKRDVVRLDNGVTVYGSPDGVTNDGKYTGTVIYAKRSKCVVGGWGAGAD